MEHDEKDVKKMDDKVKKAAAALKEEEAEISNEDKAEKALDLEKKKQDKEDKKDAAARPKLHYLTVPDKDVELRSADLKHETAGNYRRSKDLQIHDHPVWIKVQPSHNRVAYWQEEHWHITDLAHLKGMLAEAKADPKKTWENALITSKNKVEFFYEAIWNDGTHDLKPDAVVDAKEPIE